LNSVDLNPTNCAGSSPNAQPSRDFGAKRDAEASGWIIRKLGIEIARRAAEVFRPPKRHHHKAFVQA